ncbi:acyl-CoA carboxylase subunit epsilon [Agrococcus sp. HG114]|uniref:acyl-CoA carboxylase subunit epsilon n=1 Tax=Agrococcus sp. HG114 TaxID=2969757 RepID=UPI00215AF143|nr:acyl-CoA carboxylase subunit epsilon [Agrococcus sp. HG114]MCR8671010.1 acyl-CoA carboxylase subunit epsilon [Agrococcus sp. HG114]
MSAAPDDASEPRMAVVGGSPTPEERAAVEAVLTGMAAEWAETKHRRVLDSESEWQSKSRLPDGRRWQRD